MANTKPFVALACICEKALQEKDGVLSLIRVIDTVNVRPGTPAGIKPAIEYVAVISLKSGDIFGSFDKLQIAMRAPNGKVKRISKHTIPTMFNGGAHGVNVQIKLTIVVEEFGLFWFDVVWGDEVLTSIPLDVKAEERTGHQ